MGTDITLARCFDEHSSPVVQLPYLERWAVVQLVEENRDTLYCPLLVRVAKSEYGAADDVVYAPRHVHIMRGEIETLLTFLSDRKDEEAIELAAVGPTSVGNVRGFLQRLRGVADEALRDGKGMFVWAD